MEEYTEVIAIHARTEVIKRKRTTWIFANKKNKKNNLNNHLEEVTLLEVHCRINSIFNSEIAVSHC